MPEPTPSISELRASITPPPEGVDLAIALIAEVPPKILDSSVANTIWKASLARHGASDSTAVHAETMLELTTEQPYSRAARREAREFLEKALADQADSAQKYRELQPDLELALDVDARKIRLSRPVRWLAAIGLAVSVGGGITAFMYEGAQSANREAIVRTQLDNAKYPEYKQPMPQESLDSGQVAGLAYMGFVATAVGALGGTFLGLRLSGSAAQSRAKRIVRKASQ